MPLELNDANERYASSSRSNASLAEELSEDIGELKARIVLGFVLKEIGPTIYNQAIDDAQTWLQERSGDLASACWEPEFGYWERKP